MVCCTHQCNTRNALTSEGDTDFWFRFIRPPGSRKPTRSASPIRIVEGRVADVGAGTGLCKGDTRNKKEEEKEKYEWYGTLPCPVFYNHVLC